MLTTFHFKMELETMKQGLGGLSEVTEKLFLEVILKWLALFKATYKELVSFSQSKFNAYS